MPRSRTTRSRAIRDSQEPRAAQQQGYPGGVPQQGYPGQGGEAPPGMPGYPGYQAGAGYQGGPNYAGGPAVPGQAGIPVSQLDMGSFFEILIPIKSWLHDRGWRQGIRLLIIPYALLPLIFLQLFSTSNLAQFAGLGVQPVRRAAVAADVLVPDPPARRRQA